MFILDSLLIAGIRWSLETALTAAEAEMNDDSVLREQLLEAEMRREMGEISDEDFQIVEADLLARIRDIKQRREGAGPLAFSGQPLETTGDAAFQVEASVSGDFHDPITAPHTTIVHSSPSGGEEVALLDIEPGNASPAVEPVIEPAARRRAPKLRGKPARNRAAAVRPRSPERTPTQASAATPARSRSARSSVAGSSVTGSSVTGSSVTGSSSAGSRTGGATRRRSTRQAAPARRPPTAAARATRSRK